MRRRKKRSGEDLGHEKTRVGLCAVREDGGKELTPRERLEGRDTENETGEKVQEQETDNNEEERANKEKTKKKKKITKQQMEDKNNGLTSQHVHSSSTPHSTS